MHRIQLHLKMLCLCLFEDCKLSKERLKFWHKYKCSQYGPILNERPPFCHYNTQFHRNVKLNYLALGSGILLNALSNSTQHKLVISSNAKKKFI